MRRWQIILISPQTSGNIGAAARVAKNFGASGLRIIAPRCEVQGDEARRFSSGAAELLRRATIYDTLQEATKDLQLTIGLTGVSGKLHKLDCIEQIPTKLIEGKEKLRRCGLIFGREEKGMEGDEMEQCNFLWSLPTSAKFPSLNLAQAIGITLASVAEAERQLGMNDLGLGLAPSESTLNPLAGSTDPQDQPATTEEFTRLFARIEDLMIKVGWPNETKLRLSMGRLQNILSRASATKREINTLHGLYSQTKLAVDHPEKFEKYKEREFNKFWEQVEKNAPNHNEENPPEQL